MKVKLEDGYRGIYTLDDLDRAKAVIAFEKEDEYTIKDWMNYAADEALKDENGSVIEILKAEAHTAKNCRAWNLYGEETGDMDVWVQGIVRLYEGVAEIGAYLSDIWGTGAKEYKHHMYIRKAYWND